MNCQVCLFLFLHPNGGMRHQAALPAPVSRHMIPSCPCLRPRTSSGTAVLRPALPPECLMEVTSSFSSKASDLDYGYGSSMSSSQLPSSRASACPSPGAADQSSLVSLISEISCTDSDSLEQMERENAHFSISESVIQVFEEMRWSQEQSPDCGSRFDRSMSTPLPPLNPSSQSSDEISFHDQSLHSNMPDDEVCKQWIRIKGRISCEEEVNLLRSPSQSSLSDSEVDPLNCSMTSHSITEQMDRLEAAAFLPIIKNWGVSLSNTSLFSLDDDSASKNSDLIMKYDTSAENIAYSLLRRFSLVNDAEVQKARTNWIIAEDSNDVPQKLLPIPNSTPISPDQVEDEMVKSISAIKLRGNFDWAPPRKQIIFCIHTPKSGSKKAQMALQNFRCAGCGQRIEEVYFPRMLFCFYTGKYFCQFGCHRNQKSIIPALILNKWDFRLHPVSTFAFNLIKSIRNEKLFDLQSLQLLPILQKKSRSLSRIVYLRSQVVPLRQYISSCKRGGNVLLYYLIFDPKDLVNFDCRDLFLFSLDDLVRAKTDTKLVDRFVQLVNTSVKHISGCSSCRARGFYCEICSAGPSNHNSEKDLIFPFEFGRVTSCQICGACVHTKCLKQTPDHQCLKCKRRRLRAISSSDMAED